VEEIKIFSAQAIMIFLLGFQQMNVTGRHYFAAAVTSFLLGVCGWTITSTIAASHQEGLWSTVGIAFLVAGPMGILAAMEWHGKLIKLLYGRKDES
jgi:uncharacterized membrane protein YraQ (UPF0718 family)